MTKEIMGIITVATIVPLIIFKFFSARKYLHEKKRIEKHQQAKEKAQTDREKVKPVWDLASTTLATYFNRNIDQITSIFRLSVAVMFLGFVIICGGIYQTIRAPQTSFLAVITSVAGIITEFIGATFLFIYRSTVQQALTHTKTLERINAVGMAMEILDTMDEKENDEHSKNKTKAKIVECLVAQTYAKESRSDNMPQSEEIK